MGWTLNRRDFLAYGGATLAGVTLGETGRRWLARADERSRAFAPRPMAETWAASVCRECPACCGVRVRVIDGAPVKVEGNPNCPITRGRLCAKGQAALESYFDPERLVGPARRAGRRGDNTWTRIGWPEAIALVASHVRDASPTAAIVAISADDHGPIADAWSGFWNAAHAQLAWAMPATADRLVPAFQALTGAPGVPVFDLEHATHVLSFGAPLVEDWLSSVWAQRSYGRFRRSPSRARGRLIQVDQRRSLTARKADEWLPVAADRQALLAYGIASVLMREDRIDRAQLGGNTAEFESTLVTEFTPDAVALATGVPVVTLLRLARDLVATPQPLVIVAADAPRDLTDAVFALNALIGAIDRPGGIFVASSGDAAPRADRSAVDALEDVVERRQPTAMLALRDSAALRSLAGPADARRALEPCRFIVSFSPYLDEAAAAADVLLPTHTSFEAWHASVPPASDGTDKLACARPAVAPRLDTQDLVAVLHAIGQAIGGPAATAVPASAEAAVQLALDRLWRLRRGGPYATSFETNWARQMERGGWWVPPTSSREAFGRVVLDAGGWVDPYVPSGVLRRTVSARGLKFAPPPAGALVIATPEVVTASQDEMRRPSTPSMATLQLVTFTPATVNLSGDPNQPALFELLGQPDNAPWRVWAELHPDTARRFGIIQGATIRIASATGSIQAVAAIVEHLPEGVIAVPFVPAVPFAGRWARRVDSDVRHLWADGAARDPIRVGVAPV
jgi:anaerobic selenocysteine-containing dehydrogenase